MMIVSGCMMSFFSVGGATVQRILDDKYRGRATGIFMMTWGFMPIGSLAAGILAAEFGASNSTYLGSITLAVFIVVCFYTFKDVWEYKHSPTISPNYLTLTGN
jgi:MFS family permease